MPLLKHLTVGQKGFYCVQYTTKGHAKHALVTKRSDLQTQPSFNRHVYDHLS